MIDIDKILSQEKIGDIISSLKERTTLAPNWSELKKEYEPSLHEIVDDHQGRQDKIHSNGTKDAAARLAIGLEKLITKRMMEFTFAIPVKRTYDYDADNEKQKAIAKAIERIYTVAHIDSVNKERAIAYFASCECLTLWYTKKTPTTHNLYGFPCNYKLKCKTFSPMDGTKLYPLIDEFGEMYAMSFEYRKKVKDTWVTYFETYTAKQHFQWCSFEGGDWEVVKNGDEISILKIPAVYIYRKKPIWDGLCALRKDLEYTISRNSDVVAYNSAPILKVAGQIVGEEVKGETRRVYRVQEGGDVSYVAWNQSDAAQANHVKTLLNLYFMLSQLPDISFENMRALGNIGYDARKLLFTDAHMKVGDESGTWIESFEREGNVIKAFLKKLNVESGELGFKADDIDSVLIDHKITAYIQEDEELNIKKWKEAGGDTPLVSPLEAIEKAGLSENPQSTLEQIMAYQMAVNASGNESSTEEEV